MLDRQPSRSRIDAEADAVIRVSIRASVCAWRRLGGESVEGRIRVSAGNGGGVRRYSRVSSAESESVSGSSENAGVRGRGFRGDGAVGAPTTSCCGGGSEL